MLCTRLTKLVIALLKPRWASMRTWAALWSREGVGPRTFPASFSVANFFTPAVILARSAPVSPDGRT